MNGIVNIVASEFVGTLREHLVLRTVSYCILP